eukprot:m.227701 g.227701  ORF g.227701 m.227701 type:complete len:119 (+) comp15665_c0_seq5:249-605(+)
MTFSSGLVVFRTPPSSAEESHRRRCLMQDRTNAKQIGRGSCVQSTTLASSRQKTNRPPDCLGVAGMNAGAGSIPRLSHFEADSINDRAVCGFATARYGLVTSDGGGGASGSSHGQLDM